jgi:hypothetical protein
MSVLLFYHEKLKPMGSLPLGATVTVCVATSTSYHLLIRPITAWNLAIRDTRINYLGMKL